MAFRAEKIAVVGMKAHRRAAQADAKCIQGCVQYIVQPIATICRIQLDYDNDRHWKPGSFRE